MSSARAVLAAAQRPISIDRITVPAGRPLCRDLTSWCLPAEQDHVIVPVTRPFMAPHELTKGVPIDHMPASRRQRRSPT